MGRYMYQNLQNKILRNFDFLHDFFLGASGFRVLDVVQDPYPISNRPDAHKSSYY